MTNLMRTLFFLLLTAETLSEEKVVMVAGEDNNYFYLDWDSHTRYLVPRNRGGDIFEILLNKYDSSDADDWLEDNGRLIKKKYLTNLDSFKPVDANLYLKGCHNYVEGDYYHGLRATDQGDVEIYGVGYDGDVELNKGKLHIYHKAAIVLNENGAVIWSSSITSDNRLRKTVDNKMYAFEELNHSTEDCSSYFER